MEHSEDRGVVSLEGLPGKTSQRRWNLIGALKPVCSLELGGRASQVEGFLCTEARSWGVWAFREPREARRKADHAIAMGDGSPAACLSTSPNTHVQEYFKIKASHRNSLAM